MRILLLDAQKNVRRENLEAGAQTTLGPKLTRFQHAFVIGPTLPQWILPHAPIVAVCVLVMFIERVS
jgi:hypothetical protein